MLKNKWMILIVMFALICSVSSCSFLSDSKRISNEKNAPGLYMEIKLEPIDVKQSTLSKEDMIYIRDIMERRINSLGVGNSSLTVEGRIIKIKLPGYTNTEEAKNVIGKTGELLFTDEIGGVIVSGKNLKSSNFAFQTVSEGGVKEPVIQLTFDEEGKKLFAEGTKANIGKTILITLDEQIIMAPKVNGSIKDGTVIITFGGKGEDVVKTAKKMASILKGGSIPAKVVILKSEIR